MLVSQCEDGFGCLSFFTSWFMFDIKYILIPLNLDCPFLFFDAWDLFILLCLFLLGHALRVVYWTWFLILPSFLSNNFRVYLLMIADSYKMRMFALMRDESMDKLSWLNFKCFDKKSYGLIFHDGLFMDWITPFALFLLCFSRDSFSSNLAFIVGHDEKCLMHRKGRDRIWWYKMIECWS